MSSIAKPTGWGLLLAGAVALGAGIYLWGFAELNAALDEAGLGILFGATLERQGVPAPAGSKALFLAAFACWLGGVAVLLRAGKSTKSG